MDASKDLSAPEARCDPPVRAWAGQLRDLLRDGAEDRARARVRGVVLLLRHRVREDIVHHRLTGLRESGSTHAQGVRVLNILPDVPLSYE